MRSATDVLPSSVSTPRLSARLWLALAAALGCGVCAYAGLYPRFDEGKLRLVLVVCCAPFAAAVVAAALGAKSAEAALARAVLFSSVLGVAATILPAAMLSRHGGGEFVGACMFGAFFGAPTGALYGLPLGALCALGFRHVNARTHEATDRAARVGGAWLVVVSLLGAVGTLLLDTAKMDWATETMAAPSRLPLVIALAGVLAGTVAVVRPVVRMRRRSAWLARVRAGLEPTFRVRAVDVRDHVDGLPRISDGAAVEVVEWCPDELGGVTSGAAYRAAAVGTAVALVSEERSGASSAA
jgi:hypothetical protein